MGQNCAQSFILIRDPKVKTFSLRLVSKRFALHYDLSESYDSRSFLNFVKEYEQSMSLTMFRAMALVKYNDE